MAGGTYRPDSATCRERLVEATLMLAVARQTFTMARQTFTMDGSRGVDRPGVQEAEARVERCAIEFADALAREGRVKLEHDPQDDTVADDRASSTP